jgi:hypothetical protein
LAAGTPAARPRDRRVSGGRRCRLRGPSTGGRVQRPATAVPHRPETQRRGPAPGPVGSDRHRGRTGRSGVAPGRSRRGSGRRARGGSVGRAGVHGRPVAGAPLGRQVRPPRLAGHRWGRVLRPGLGRGHAASRCGERESYLLAARQRPRSNPPAWP